MEDNIKLLVAGIGRNRYAIREADVQSVHEIQRVHRIPFAPSTFSGISSIDGDMTRLFDLPACLGHEPLNGRGEGQALALSGTGGRDAFLVKGGLARIEVRSESLLPMPRHLSTPVLEHCVLHSRRLMPIVNLKKLYRHLLEGQLAPPPLSLPETSRKTRSSSGLTGKGVMVLKIGGETFAVPGNLAAHRAVRLPRLVDMPLAPPYAPGIVHRDGKIWTVMDPSVRLGIHHGNDRRLFLPLEGKSFGLLVHGSRGRLKAEELNVQPLPSPLKSDILNSVVVSKDEIVPFLETNFLPTGSEVEFAEVKYKTASKFRTHFKKKPVRILIFELEGQRFGVPVSQVETDVAALPFRSLPSSRPVAVGVAQRDAMVLPVLDLARCFGGKSLVGPGWRMIQLKDGNFRGLLLAERVLGEVTLPPGDQIKLPTSLSSMFVHGCFLQDEVLRLILDIEALVTHFRHEETDDPFRYLIKREWKEEDLLHAELKADMGLPLSAGAVPELETPGALENQYSPDGTHPPTAADEKEPDDKREVTPYLVAPERPSAVERESAKTTPQTDPLPDEEHETDRDKGSFGEQSAFVGDEKEHDGHPRIPDEENLCEPPVTESGERDQSPPEAGRNLHQEDRSEPGSTEPGATDEAETLLPGGLSTEPERLEKPVQLEKETADKSFSPTPSVTTDPGKERSRPQHGDVPPSVSDTENQVADRSGEPADGAPDRFRQPKNDEQQEPSFEEVDDAAAKAPGSPPADRKPETLLDGGLLSVGSEQVRVPPFKQDAYRPRDGGSVEVETSRADGAVWQPGRRRSRANWLALLVFLLLAAGGSFFTYHNFEWPTKRQTADHVRTTVVDSSDTADARRSGSYEIPENSPGGAQPKMLIADDTPSVPSRPTNVSYPKEIPDNGQTSDHLSAADPTDFAAVQENSNEKGVAIDMPMAKISGIGSRPSKEAPPSLIMELKPGEGVVSVKSISVIPGGAKPPAGSMIHVVKRGDTLWDIAQQYTGNPFNYPSLANASGIENPDLIFPGQKIAILITRARDR